MNIPVEVGKRPVISAALYGVHRGQTETAFLKITDSFERSSRFGVFTMELPLYPKAVDRHWSVRIYMTFGFWALPGEQSKVINNTRYSLVFMMNLLAVYNPDYSSNPCRVTMGTYPTSSRAGGVTIKAGSISANFPIIGGGRYSRSFVQFR